MNYLAYFLPQLYRKNMRNSNSVPDRKKPVHPRRCTGFSVYYIKYSLVSAVKSATLLSFQIQ